MLPLGTLVYRPADCSLKPQKKQPVQFFNISAPPPTAPAIISPASGSIAHGSGSWTVGSGASVSSYYFSPNNISFGTSNIKSYMEAKSLAQIDLTTARIGVILDCAYMRFAEGETKLSKKDIDFFLDLKFYKVFLLKENKVELWSINSVEKIEER